jgi:hypothetical protein
MEIRFRTTSTQPEKAIAAHARRTLQARMQHLGDRVDHIDVKLGDPDGRRPCQDGYCILRVKLPGLSALTVAHLDADIYRAIDRAVERVGRLVVELLRGVGSPPAAAALAGSA